MTNLIASRSKGRPPRPAGTRRTRPQAPTGTLKANTNSRTRDPQQRALWLAAKAAAERSNSRKALASQDAELAATVEVITEAPTSSVYRMVGTGHDGTGHRGAEVAKMLATGQANVTRRGKDAAGPLKEDVGLTTQRGGATDYRRDRSSRLENTQPLSIDAQGIRAQDVAAYDSRDHGVRA